jgi:multiple sugar transport system ATP-binding protein
VAECARHAGSALTFGLRPEHISAGTSAEPLSIALRSEVMLVEPLGSDTLGLVKLGTGTDAGEMTGRFPPEAGLVVGTPITISLALNRFHLFDPDTGVAVRGADW